MTSGTFTFGTFATKKVSFFKILFHEKKMPPAFRSAHLQTVNMDLKVLFIHFQLYIPPGDACNYFKQYLCKLNLIV